MLSSHKHHLLPCRDSDSTVSAVWFWCELPFWRVAWLCLGSGTSGIIKGMMSLVVLEVVGLHEQPEVLSLINLASGVATLLIGQLTGVHACMRACVGG